MGSAALRPCFSTVPGSTSLPCHRKLCRPRSTRRPRREWEAMNGRVPVGLSIPSPSTGVWEVFGLPLRAYALCIIAGIVDAMKIWQGGLGVWGAVAGGVLGAYLVARRRQIVFPALLDAVAPAIVVAQAIGRLGNWFNQELFGRPTSLPWALEIDPAFRPLGYGQYPTFHPTFLYELVWNLLVAVALVLLDRKFRLGHGKVFALYVIFYTLGRFWIEALRIDQVNEIGGFRLNNYTSLIAFVAALGWFLWLVRNRPGREEVVE